MLELIAKYAVDEGLTVRPGFTAKTVKWLISLDEEGNYVGVQTLGNASDKKNPGKEFRDCPEFPSNVMKSGGKAHPIIESLNVVALLGKSASGPASEEDIAKHKYFVALLDELGEEVDDAKICAQSLGNHETLSRIRNGLVNAKAKASDKATLAIHSHILAENPKVSLWWEKRSKAGKVIPQDESARCLATGKITVPLATHPPIMGLGGVGGRGNGDLLISFDKRAFSSFGLEQSANAVVSEPAAMQYRAGLNHIISHGKKLGPMILGHWFSKNVRAGDDVLSWLFDGEDNQVDKINARSRMQELLSAIETGERADLASYRYFILSVSGSKGRVMVRDWQEGQYGDLVKAIDAWFRDLSICGITTEFAKVPSLEGLLFAHLRRKKQGENFDNWIAPSTPFVVPIFNAAVRPPLRSVNNPGDGLSVERGYPLPMSSLQRILPRLTIDFSSGDYVNIASELARRSEQGQDLGLRYSRLTATMAFLKAHVIRSPKSEYGEYMEPHLNDNHPSKAYQAGRLMAVLAEIQDASDRDVKATIIQRFYPAASSTPALVFGRLDVLSQSHLRKIERERPGLAHTLEIKKAMIWNQIRNGLPRVFSLDEKTLFALGYYQQIAKNEIERSNRKSIENPDTDQGDEK